MREGGLNLGGEQSGHIVLGDYATTGDGLMAALQILAAVLESGKPMSEVGQVFKRVPQVLKNVRYSDDDPLEDASVKQAIADVETSLANTGRVLIRKSGTEPLIRVMIEGEDAKQIEAQAQAICDAIEAVVNPQAAAANG